MTSDAQRNSGYLLPETIDPETRICIQFEIPDTPEYRRACKGAVMTLAQWFTWEKSYPAADTRASEAAQLFRQAINETYTEGCENMDCDDVVDCMEANDDYIALSQFQLSSLMTATEAHAQALDAEYDGSPQSINAAIPTVAPDSDESNALCYALAQWVELYAAMKTAQIQNKNNLQIVWSRIKEYSKNFYDRLPDYAIPVRFANIYDCFVTDSAAITALADSAAIEEVICCLSDALALVVMSETNWNTALSGCVSSLTDTAHDIACLINNDNDTDLYLSLLEGYGIALDRQTEGDILDCPCSGGWCYKLPLEDFELFDFSGATPGLQEAGQLIGDNWVTSDVVLTGGFTNRAIGIEYDVGFDITTTSVQAFFDATAGYGTLGTDIYVARIQLFNGASLQYDSGTGATPNFSQDSYAWSGSVTWDRIRYWCVVSRSTGGLVAGSETLSDIVVRGNGTNPFGADNC